MKIFFPLLINGIALGGIYALMVTGLNLLMLVGGVFQFAYPHLVVMSMYISWMVLHATGDNLALGIPAAIGAGVGMSLLSEPLFRPLIRKGGMIPSFILAMGMGMMLTDIMCRLLHGGVPVGFPLTLSGQEALVRIGIATLTRGQLATLIGCFSVVVGFLYLLNRTRIGRAFRAVGENPDVARLLGIPILKTNMYSYVMAGLLGGISALFLAMALGSAYCALGDRLALVMFATVMFAGLGNLQGGLICALIVGLVESFALGYLHGEWAQAIVFAVIMVAVAIRPRGIFGMRV